MRDTERERDIQRQRQGQRERDRERWRQRERDRQTETERDRERETEREKLLYRKVTNRLCFDTKNCCCLQLFLNRNKNIQVASVIICGGYR